MRKEKGPGTLAGTSLRGNRFLYAILYCDGGSIQGKGSEYGKSNKVDLKRKEAKKRQNS